MACKNRTLLLSTAVLSLCIHARFLLARSGVSVSVESHDACDDAGDDGRGEWEERGMRLRRLHAVLQLQMSQYITSVANTNFQFITTTIADRLISERSDKAGRQPWLALGTR